ncbi:hypothetical protein RHGRI_028754 [Rhododendron griersonianum]|uniref:Peptidase M50B-like protein n=1 Tax=Rhododendron griersonianum TaxID=479676 RepID=A0AAV6IHF5_9ERIC|nr:hypothetical protein RHGRI_028754 [Rhododendron griersonianum]
MNCSESASKRSSGDRFGIGYNAELGAPRLLRPRPEGVPCHHRKGLYLILIIIQLWRTFLLTPFKLITVFLHEASHAIACILTCGTIVESILVAAYIFTYFDMQVEGMEVHANEGGVTQTRGGAYWVILPAGYLGSSFWGMIFILASTNLLTTRIAAGCFAVALLIVLFVAKNVSGDEFLLVQLAICRCHILPWTLRGLCVGFIVLFAVVWVLQEFTKVRILRYVILFIDIYDDLISRRVNSSDAEKFAEVCPCPCNGAAWGVIWFSDLDGILLDIVETGEHSFIPIISSIALRVSFSSYSFRFLIHLRPQVSIYCET